MPDQNIALGVQVPDQFKSISGMLNFAGQAQNYAKNALELEKAKQTFESDVERSKAESSRSQSEARVSSETADPRIQQSLLAVQKATTEATAAAQGLNQDQRGIVAGVVGTLGRAGIKDRNIYSAELENLKKVNPGNKSLHGVIDAYNDIIKNLPPDANLPGVAVGASQYLLTPTQAQTQLSPTAGTIGMGGTVNQVTNTPSVMGAPPSAQIAPNGTPVTLAPGSTETIEVGPDKQQYVVTRSQNGTVLSTRPLAGGPGGGTGGGPAMPNFRPGDAESISTLEAERNQARNLLASAPIAHTTNKGILTEIDNAIATGKFGPSLAGIASRLGAVWDTPEKAASAYDLIGKYTERNALEAAKAMGPGTNAGLEAAIKANGSAAYNPTALKKITRLNDAIVTGAELYQPGLEAAIKADPQRGVLAKRDFDQSWAQNFDPMIMELSNAQKEGDQKTIQEIMKSIGGKDSAKAKELIRKAAVLDRLSTTGKP